MSRQEWKRNAKFIAASVLGALACGCQSTKPNAPPELGMSPQVQGPNSPDLAQTTFREKVTIDQEYKVHMDLGRMHDIQGNFGEAVSEYQRALEVAMKPAKGFSAHRFTPADVAAAHRRMGASLDRMGLFAQSETHYQKALDLVPEDGNAWNDAGYSYYLQGRWPEAERTLKTALQKAPGDPKIGTNLGLTLAASGREQEAYEMLAKVAGPMAAHANLGYVLASSGRVEEARSHYKAALELQPNFRPFLVALARLDKAGAPGAGAATSTIAQGDSKSPTGPTAAGMLPPQDDSIARASAAPEIPAPAPVGLPVRAN